MLTIGLAAVISLVGCEQINGILNPGTPGGGGIPWTAGDSIPVARQSIGTAGGILTVSDPDGPLDGMTIGVPAGAMLEPTRFDISYTPITGTIAPNVDPLTPLITVDNGGAFADGIMTVTIPVAIPAGHFAMGFFVDEDGQLEGMPLASETPSSITVATAHFCSFFIAMIADSLLTGTIDTGFRPMTDDWQFPNDGSYIAPGGHCSGQALSAMWYYIERTQQGASTLWNRFDNNGDAPASPDFWLDDSLGYRLASVVQHDIDWDNWLLDINMTLGDSDDSLNWRAFLYAMLLTGEPQSVGIYNASSGHDMVAYKADADTGTLYIADPNYPGDSSRKVQYTNGAFASYSSEGDTYNEIRYCAKTATIPWSQIGARWNEFDLATIGDGVFPSYSLEVSDDVGSAVPLTDGMVVSGSKLKVELVCDAPAISLAAIIFRDEEPLPFDSDGKIDLLDGDNRLGICVAGKVGKTWAYVDFQWVTVRRAAAGYVQIGVSVHGYWEYNQPEAYNPDTGLPGVIDYYEDLLSYANSFTAYANRAFTGNTFTAHWSGYHIGGDPQAEGPYTGSMTVTFNDDMSEVISFYAADSQIIGGIDGYDRTWSAGGTNIPRTRIGNGFYEYKVDGAECYDHINAFSNYTIFNAYNDTRTLTHYTCDVYSGIGIVWYEEVPEWFK